MATINVSNTSSLSAALKSAQSGDTIRLASGTYSGLDIRNLSFSSSVTITSADPGKKAILTDFAVNSVKGLTFSSVEMATIPQSDATIAKGPWAFRVINSSDISFDKVYVHGSIDGNASNDVRGLQIRDSKNISVTNSEFRQLDKALAIGTTINVHVSGNKVHEMRADGFNFAQVQNVRIDGNTFTDFRPVGADHPDAIQFWTSGTTVASRDIVISNNIIMRGEGQYTQGIFMRDELGTSPFERVTITGNTIIGTGWSGLRVDGSKDLKITDNQLLSLVGDNQTNLLVQNANGAIVSNNSTASLSVSTSTNVTQSGNTLTLAVKDFGAAAIDRLVSTLGDRTGLLQEVRLQSKVLQELAYAEGAKDQWLKGDFRGNLLEGFGGNDTLEGGGGSDTLMGGTGDDVYIVPNTLARIVESAGQGQDTVVVSSEYWLGANIENLTLTPGTTTGWQANGNELDNRILGNAGSNRLTGFAGNDTIDGGVGADTIVGGQGDDRLTGGAGADTFRFTPGSGRDTVTDFGWGVDKDTLDISAYLNAGMRPTVTKTDQGALISFANGDAITLAGINASELGTVSKVGWIL